MGDENALSTIKFSFNMKSFAKIEPHSSFINMVTTTGTTYVVRYDCGGGAAFLRKKGIVGAFSRDLRKVCQWSIFTALVVQG